MKNFVDRRVGRDVVDFVGDIRRFEETGRKRGTTWARGEGKEGKRRVQNTMGYQSRKSLTPSSDSLSLKLEFN